MPTSISYLACEVEVEGPMSLNSLLMSFPLDSSRTWKKVRQSTHIKINALAFDGQLKSPGYMDLRQITKPW